MDPYPGSAFDPRPSVEELLIIVAAMLVFAAVAGLVFAAWRWWRNWRDNHRAGRQDGVARSYPPNIKRN